MYIADEEYKQQTLFWSNAKMTTAHTVNEIYGRGYYETLEKSFGAQQQQQLTWSFYTAFSLVSIESSSLMSVLSAINKVLRGT